MFHTETGYPIPPGLQIAKITYLTLAVIILCDDYTGCDGMYDYFALEADKMIGILYEVDLNKD